MKLKVMTALLLSLSSFAQSDRRNNPQAPILIECSLNEGEQVTYRVMELFFNSKTGKTVGMGFGPNRGDEGFVELVGECAISAQPQSFKGME